MTIFSTSRTALAGLALICSAGLAQAAEITDFELVLDGTYATGSTGLALAGGYNLFVTDDTSTPRDYTLSVSASATGLGSFDDSFPISSALGSFSLDQAGNAILNEVPELGFVLGYLVNNSSGGIPNVLSYSYTGGDTDAGDGIDASGDFTINISDNVLPCGIPGGPFGQLPLPNRSLSTTTTIPHNGGGCPEFNGDFNLSVALTYEDNVAAVPLPASLPLLLAGVGGIGALRRSRKTRA